jgi:hypothetical protein
MARDPILLFADEVRRGHNLFLPIDLLCDGKQAEPCYVMATMAGFRVHHAGAGGCGAAAAAWAAPGASPRRVLGGCPPDHFAEPTPALTAPGLRLPQCPTAAPMSGD